MKEWLKVEAVLFGSGKYLTEDEISTLSGVPKKSLKHALSELKKHYSSIESSLDIFNEGDAWKLNVREDFAGIVKNVISEAEMPKAIMETLALIAYKSPVLQSEIIDSRGSGAYDHIALLEDKGFISREKSGRSFKLRTAPKFFDYFDIDGDSKLRAMFKDVKKPQQLGSLEVYTAKTEEETEVEFEGKILDRMKKVETTPADHAEKEEFLNSFDTKISQAKSAIDETDNEMNEFRRIVPHEDAQHSENVNSKNETDDAESVLKKFDAEMEKLERATADNEEESLEETNEDKQDEPQKDEDGADGEEETEGNSRKEEAEEHEQHAKSKNASVHHPVSKPKNKAAAKKTAKKKK